MSFAKLCLRPIRLRVITGAVGAVLLTIFNALPAGAQSYPEVKSSKLLCRSLQAAPSTWPHASSHRS